MSRDALIARIEATATKTAQSRERKQKKGSATGYISVWNEAIIEHSDKTFRIAPTVRSSGMLAKALNRIDAPVSTRNKFLTWTIANWTVEVSRLRNAAKGSRKAYPEFPDLNFFIFLIEKLYLAYCRKDQSSVVSSVPEKKQKQAEASTADRDQIIAQKDAEILGLRTEIQKLKARISLLTKG